MKVAETTAAAMSVFPFNTVVNTLGPLIRTDPYPSVLGAIKMLTKLIEYNPNEVTDDHLEAIMPGLIKVKIFIIFFNGIVHVLINFRVLIIKRVPCERVAYFVWWPSIKRWVRSGCYVSSIS